jgi:hypothetical protein
MQLCSGQGMLLAGPRRAGLLDQARLPQISTREVGLARHVCHKMAPASRAPRSTAPSRCARAKVACSKLSHPGIGYSGGAAPPQECLPEVAIGELRRLHRQLASGDLPQHDHGDQDVAGGYKQATSVAHRPSRMAWSQGGRSFGPSSPDRASGDTSLPSPPWSQSTRFLVWCSPTLIALDDRPEDHAN